MAADRRKLSTKAKQAKSNYNVSQYCKLLLLYYVPIVQ